jgi:hypothetical protein
VRWGEDDYVTPSEIGWGECTVATNTRLSVCARADRRLCDDEGREEQEEGRLLSGGHEECFITLLKSLTMTRRGQRISVPTPSRANGNHCGSGMASAQRLLGGRCITTALGSRLWPAVLSLWLLQY